MNGSSEEVLQDLLSRAERAKALSDQIKTLKEWDSSEQRDQLKINSQYSCSNERKWPDEYEVRILLELGRQRRLKQLQDELQAVLNSASSVVLSAVQQLDANGTGVGEGDHAADGMKP